MADRGDTGTRRPKKTNDREKEKKLSRQPCSSSAQHEAERKRGTGEEKARRVERMNESDTD